MKKLLSTILVLTLSLGAYAAPEIKGNPEDLQKYFHPKEKTLVIQDNAEETAFSDEAIIHLVVKTKNKLLSTAMKANSTLRGKIKAALTAKGISSDDIKNSKFSSSPQYGWFGSEPASYEVINRVAINISSEAHLQNIAELADQYSEVTLSGTTFEHSKKKQFEQLVKKKALDKVLAKKAFYESSLGIVLEPISFNESAVDFMATQGANLLAEEIVVTGMRKNASRDASYSRTSAPAPQAPSSFDEVRYRASVTVEFRVKH